jgi:hypothetical protein
LLSGLLSLIWLFPLPRILPCVRLLWLLLRPFWLLRAQDGPFHALPLPLLLPLLWPSSLRLSARLPGVPVRLLRPLPGPLPLLSGLLSLIWLFPLPRILPCVRLPWLLLRLFFELSELFPTRGDWF